MQINMKGSFAAAIAAIGIIVMLYAVNSQTQNSNINDTFIEMQAERELSAKMAQAARLLDKATGNGAMLALTPACNVFPPGQLNNQATPIINATISNINSKTGMDCILGADPVHNSLGLNVTTTMTLTCTMRQMNGNLASKTTNLIFYKTAFNDAGVCKIRDPVSGCVEFANDLPAFDPGSC